MEVAFSNKKNTFLIWFHQINKIVLGFRIKKEKERKRDGERERGEQQTLVSWVIEVMAVNKIMYD